MCNDRNSANGNEKGCCVFGSALKELSKGSYEGQRRKTRKRVSGERMKMAGYILGDGDKKKKKRDGRVYVLV